MTKACVWILLFLGLALSCAVPVPPTGGPEDKQPPEIVGTVPDSGETGVSVTSPITITFSEKMVRSKIERLVGAFPPFEIGEVTWNKNSISIQPAAPLIADTTYLLVIKPGFRDSHNVSKDEGISFPFATGAHLDSGMISGTVLFRRKPTAQAVVRCFLIRADTIFDPAATRPDREAGSDKEGNFQFAYLPTDGKRFVVWAFHDQNRNAYFERGQEFGEAYTDTITLTAAAPLMGGAAITIVDPTEPGEIAGVIVNRSGADSVPVAVALYARADTLEKVALYAVCDPAGTYRFKNVSPGAYMLRSFIDFKRDSLCGPYPCFDDSTRLCVEPCVGYPDSVYMGPGETVTLDSLILDPAGELADDN